MYDLGSHCLYNILQFLFEGGKDTAQNPGKYTTAQNSGKYTTAQNPAKYTIVENDTYLNSNKWTRAK